MGYKLQYPRPRFNLPIPGLKKPVGLGDAIAKGTKALGVPPCKPCSQRQQRANRVAQFVPWKRGR